MANREHLVYIPEVRIIIHLDSTDKELDVSRDIISGSIERKVNEISTASFVLHNPYNQYGGGSSGKGALKLHRGDRVSIWLKKEQWVKQFTGYLTQTPIFTYGSCTIKAEDTLWRVKNILIDSGLTNVQEILNTGYTEINKSPDAGYYQALARLLHELGGWADVSKNSNYYASGNVANGIYIEPLPPAFIEFLQELKEEAEAEEFSDYSSGLDPKDIPTEKWQDMIVNKFVPLMASSTKETIDLLFHEKFIGIGYGSEALGPERATIHLMGPYLLNSDYNGIDHSLHDLPEDKKLVNFNTGKAGFESEPNQIFWPAANESTTGLRSAAKQILSDYGYSNEKLQQMAMSDEANISYSSLWSRYLKVDEGYNDAWIPAVTSTLKSLSIKTGAQQLSGQQKATVEGAQQETGSLTNELKSALTFKDDHINKWIDVGNYPDQTDRKQLTVLGGQCVALTEKFLLEALRYDVFSDTGALTGNGSQNLLRNSKFRRVDRSEVLPGDVFVFTPGIHTGAIVGSELAFHQNWQGQWAGEEQKGRFGNTQQGAGYQVGSPAITISVQDLLAAAGQEGNTVIFLRYKDMPSSIGSASTSKNSSSDGNSSSQLTQRNFLSRNQETSYLLKGERSYQNDDSLLTWVKNITKASLRNFQTTPDGSFMAWYQDILNFVDDQVDLDIYPLDLTRDVEMYARDSEIVTHEYFSTSIWNATELSQDLQGGVSLDIFSKLVGGYTSLKKIWDRPEVQRMLSRIEGNLSLTSYDEYVNRYGVRKGQETGDPYITNRIFGTWLSLKNLLMDLSQQISTDFLTGSQLGYLPSLYPSIRVKIHTGLTDENSKEVQLLADVKGVTQSFSFTSGFSTSAVFENVRFV
jgi:hypothetical protein